MHYSNIAYLLLSLSVAKLASARPTAAVTITTTTSLAAAASTSTAPLPRVTAKHDLDKAGRPLTVPALETVTYNNGDLIKVTEQRAWSLKTEEECRNLCLAAPKVDKSLPNCLGGSYNTRTELCQLAFNAQLVEGMKRTEQCPLGWITWSRDPVEKVGEMKGAKQKRDEDMKDKENGKGEDYDHDEAIIWAACLDQGEGAMGVLGVM